LLEEGIQKIYSQHRKRLFEAMGVSFEAQTEWPLKTSTINESEARIILRSVVREPSEDLQKLAVAYYRVAYTQGDQRYLSFAWLGADILFKVRQYRLHKLRSEGNKVVDVSVSPMNDHLTEHIDEFCNSSGGVKDLLGGFKQQGRKASTLIYLYCKRHRGLKNLLYFCNSWITGKKIFKGIESDIKICLIFIMFGLDRFAELQTFTQAFLEETEVDYSGKDRCDLWKQNGSLGKRFLNFMEFMASIQFSKMKRIDLVGFGYYSLITSDTLRRLHEAAVDTYYQLCLTDNFESIPCCESQLSETQKELDKFKENKFTVDGDSFVFELPKYASRLVGMPDFWKALCEKTGCEKLYLRVLPFNVTDTIQVIASVCGTMTSVNALKKLLTPRNHIIGEFTDKELSTMLSSEVFQRMFDLDAEGDAQSLINELREFHSSD